jgi:hypothetical protein
MLTMSETKPKSNQGEFITQLRNSRAKPGPLRKFDYARQYAQPHSEPRITGKLEHGAQKPQASPEAPLGRDVPQQLNGRPDLPAIRDDLASQIRANKKRMFK